MTQTQRESARPAADPDRTRTYSWGDPASIVAALPGRSGMDVLRAMQRGELPPPPALETLGMEVERFAEGDVAFAMEPAEFHYNPLGSVHGGIIATLLDSAAGCAVHSTLPAGQGYTSVDLSTKYLRPVTHRTGRVLAHGTVLNRGTRTALAEARLLDATGRLLAHATSTCLIFAL